MNQKWILLLIGVLGLVLLASPPSALLAQDQPTLHRSRPLVKDVQTALKAKGFDPGQVDGILGPQTRQAVRAFQQANQLTGDGQLTDETLAKLGVEVPVRTGGDEPSKGLVGSVASTVASAAKTAAGATTTGAKAAAGATVTGAKATAEGAATAGEAVASGATTAGKATASGATTAGKATASAAETGAGAAAGGAETGAKATVSGAKTAGSAVGKAASATKNFLFGNDEEKELGQKVQDAFKKDRRIDPSHVDIAVSGKTVTLTFTGGNSAEWNRAVVVAKRVKGVEQVFVRTPK